MYSIPNANIQPDRIWLVDIWGAPGKGKVRHKIKKFDFYVNALFKDDAVEEREEFGGQVYFPHELLDASFLPKRYNYFFIDPGVKARYSYDGKVTKQATTVVHGLNTWTSQGTVTSQK
jgi:hypothetical protein